MIVVLRIDELNCNSDPITGMANAALDNQINLQFTGYFAKVFLRITVWENRCS